CCCWRILHLLDPINPLITTVGTQRLLRSLSVKIKATKAQANNTAENPSNDSPCAPPAVGRLRTPANPITTTIGTIAQNTHCHVDIKSTSPATTGPNPKPSKPTTVLDPVLLTKTIMTAVTNPWTTRASRIITKCGANATAIVPTKKVAIPNINKIRTEKRAAIETTAGVSTTRVRKTTVFSQWPVESWKEK